MFNQLFNNFCINKEKELKFNQSFNDEYIHLSNFFQLCSSAKSNFI